MILTAYKNIDYPAFLIVSRVKIVIRLILMIVNVILDVSVKSFKRFGDSGNSKYY